MMARTMPKQKPGKSETIVLTPPEFLTAVKSFLGIKEFDVDLAALKENSVALVYIGPKKNSLTQPWASLFLGLNRGKRNSQGWCWLNPPYDKIRPWVKKCLEEAEKGARIALLVPASVGSNWWRDYVHDKARVYFVSGRLRFLMADGTPHPTTYPKDLCLVLYGDEPGYDYLDWKEYL